jgi:hypothetical protein
MAMSTTKRKFDSVGWGFWLIVFVVAVGPCIYGLLKIGDEGVEPIVLVTFGTLAAAMVAGLFSWVVNFLLQARVSRARAREGQGHKKKRKKT